MFWGLVGLVGGGVGATVMVVMAVGDLVCDGDGDLVCDCVGDRVSSLHPGCLTHPAQKCAAHILG